MDVSFTISACISGRHLTYHHGSMISALDQAMTLLTSGMSDVVIADQSGNRSTAAALYQTLFAPKPRPAATNKNAVQLQAPGA